MSEPQAVVALHRVCDVRSSPVMSIHQPDRLWWFVHVADNYCCRVLQLSVYTSLHSSAVDSVDLVLDFVVGPFVRDTGYDDLVEPVRLLFFFPCFLERFFRCCPRQRADYRFSTDLRPLE